MPGYDPLTDMSNVNSLFSNYYGAGGFANSPHNNFMPGQAGGGGGGGFWNNWLSKLGGTSQIGAGGPNAWQSIFGGIDAKGNKFNGLGGGLLNLGTGLFNAYLGFKGLGLAEDQLNANKDAFNKNFNLQRGALLSQIRDTNAKRESFSPGSHKIEEFAALKG